MIEIIVLLEINDKIAFQEFERKAITIMSHYNGKLLSAFEPNKRETSEKNVSEVHYLQFPDIESFNHYRNDSKLMQLSELRLKAIKNTQLIISEKFKDYS